ncbi:MAG: M1 family aminopeptidase [Bacteroidota bacterium]
MFKEFFQFELRTRLRQPMVYIFIIVNFLLIYSASVSDSIQVGQDLGNVNVNSPFALMMYPAWMTFISLLMVTAFMNTSALRDYSVKYDQILFSTPLSKWGYLGGRFTGAVLAATLPALGIYLGIFLASLSGWWVDADQVGPFYLGAYLNSFLLIVLPNTLFIGAIIFALAALFRSSVISFLGAIILLVGYGVTASLMADLDNEAVVKLMDPLAINTLALETKYWTMDDKNTTWLGFSGALLLNRLLWTGVSLAIFAFTYWRFSFTRRRARKKGKAATTEASPRLVVGQTEPLPAVAVNDSLGTALSQLWHQTKLEFWGIAKSTAFIVILIAGGLNMGFGIQYVDQWFGTGNHPVTYLMVDAIRGTLYLFLFGIIMYYSGVIVWKERDAKMDEFYDASPFPTWVPMVAKFFAMVGMVAAILILGIFIGVATQAGKGYTNFEFGVYAREFLLYDLNGFALYIMLALLIQSLVNNKYLGYLVFLVVIAANAFIWSPLDVSSNLLIFGGTPSYTYSDMNAWGPYETGLRWFNLYWLAFMVLLGIAAALFWVRGKANTFAQRSSIARLRFDRSTVMLSAGVGLVWLFIGGFLYYQTKVVNTITPSDTLEERSASYERTYKQYAGIAQPRIISVDYTIDIFPEERDFLAKAEMWVVNKHNVGLDSLHFSLPSEFKVTAEMPGGELVWNDTTLRYQIYKLDQPMAPGDSMLVKIASEYISKGIENEVSNLSIVPNGTFVNNGAFMPGFGYDASRELSSRDDRRDKELPKRPRMPKLKHECGHSCANTYISSDSDWVDVHSVLSTSSDQVAIAPGSLVREWEEDGRRYFEYELDHQALNFYSFISGAYEVERDKWEGPTGEEVDVEIYYHPGHEYNVDKMVKSVKHSLSYCSSNFGPYPHSQARIIEFPRYASFAQAFPGTMPYSESIGFMADLREEDAIDGVYYVVAHEMAHQWWAHQVIGALVQGATMMSETFAQYSALMVMEEAYGKDKMKQFLEYEMDRYLRGRSGEREGEQPLLYNENQAYIHYRKGSVVMYALREYIGEDSLNAALRRYVDDVAYQEAPYTTSLECIEYIKAATPDSLQYLIEDMFETITLYSNRTTEATYKELPDGRYEVNFTVEVEKFRADSLGHETEVVFNDWIELGVLAAAEEGKQNNRLLHSERHRINSTMSTFTMIVDEEPFEAGIDPNYLLVDRFPEDNVKKLTRLE